MKRSVSIIYIIIVIAVLAVPSVGMIFAKSEWSVETTSLAEAPSLIREDGKLNKQVLSDAGNYFEDHFFARPALITANSLIRKNVFASSANEKIVVGKDGWLFYGGELSNYHGSYVIDDRGLRNIAHNLGLARDYLKNLGIDLVFTIPPNKSSLYPEYMPYYMIKNDQAGNAERLKPYLEEEGIAYADLFEAFEDAGEVLYFKEDTHWNNQGALLTYNTVMDTVSESFGKHTDRDGTDASGLAPRADHSGDLSEMLTPEAVTPETDYYPDEIAFEYVTDTVNNMDDMIETKSASGSGNLYMFRDSFGASLLPFFAGEYENAVFSRLVPYSLSQAYLSGADTVVIERVERNLSSLASDPPLMQAPASELPEDAEIYANGDGGTVITTRQDGAYLVVEGAAGKEYITDYSDIYVIMHDEASGTDTVFIPFYISEASEDNEYDIHDDRFLAYLMVDEGIRDSVSFSVAVY